MHLFTLFLILVFIINLEAKEKPPFTDYCKKIEQEIQGRKHGFMAGNVTYYIGGFHASWRLVEHETIGLTHPFHHDLRSRGVGLLNSEIKGTENTGIGNDYQGWEFYKDTKVLYGSVIINEKRYTNPKPVNMLWRPDKLICIYDIDGITIKEEKFIAPNDAAVSIITASKPITIEFEGHSFFHRNSVSSSSSIQFDSKNNSIVIKEGGKVRSKPDPDGKIRIGPCVYSGMTTVLSCSKDIKTTLVTALDENKVHEYKFSIPCDTKGITVSWAMNDNRNEAISMARDAIINDQKCLAEKTNQMNKLLNEEIPWFRCSDERFVDIYYYLWSLYLMYYIEVGKGWEIEPHTQTAVNNFLGMHRYDAAFQIKVGAWTNNKKHYAYGNVLTWKHLTTNNRYRELKDGLRMISDNKGISWHSGAYGVETCEHVLGAWQIYKHTGDVEFLRRCYLDHFDKLFKKRLPNFAMNLFEVAEKLEKISLLIGKPEDAKHWNNIIHRDKNHIRSMFDQRWESNGISNYFAGPKNGMIMTNGFWAMRSPYFPREYAKQMVNDWALNKDKGFWGDFFPLAMSKRSMEKFKTPVDHSFGYTPDTAYFTLDGMFKQQLYETATNLTVNHIINYNYHPEWKIPIAPEAYRRDLKLFGDQYSNFNAGKILLYLEGFAGLDYSIPDNKLTISPSFPDEWEWMELRLPIKNSWTRIRYNHDEVVVENSPLRVIKKQRVD